MKEHRNICTTSFNNTLRTAFPLSCSSNKTFITLVVNRLDVGIYTS